MLRITSKDDFSVKGKASDWVEEYWEEEFVCSLLSNVTSTSASQENKDEIKSMHNSANYRLARLISQFSVLWEISNPRPQDTQLDSELKEIKSFMSNPGCNQDERPQNTIQSADQILSAADSFSTRSSFRSKNIRSRV